ncbi:SCO7613 C-terminal domain-containing membrane protein [Arenivirga flava]|uniref:Uncharacterized protein n=1 Tax=Arenivirga flava TaxID=1930060 RepID=A0AA37X953_9MICO|nr:hypothetical protein [Arenivirga flava]GMA28214.1 hypothetical protein GCM10025874_14670 [Arenivirga flava]
MVVTATALLSVGFIGFLVYAFVNFGIVWQALVLGIVTAGAAVGAGLLRRSGLGRSAEGLAVFALVMSVLDVWAARANDLAGLGGGTETGYWGAALLVIGGLAVLWRRLCGIRAPGLVGAALVLPGAGLLAAASIPQAGLAERWWLAGVVAGAIGLLGGLRAPLPLLPLERWLQLGMAVAALAAAGVATTAIDLPVLADAALPVILVAALAHAAVLLRGRQGRAAEGLASAFALLAVLSLATTLLPAAARLSSAELYLLGSLPALTAAAVAAELLSRGAAAHQRRVALTAAIAAWLLATIPAGSAALAVAASWALGAASGALDWSARAAADAPVHGSLVVAAFAALAACLAVEAVGQRLGVAGSLRRLLLPSLAAALLASTPVLLPTLGGRLVLAALLVVLAFIALRLPRLERHRVPALIVALAAAAQLLALGWGGPELAWAAIAGAALLPLSVLSPRPSRGALLLGVLPLAGIGALLHPGPLSAAPWLGAVLAGVLLLGLVPWLRPDAGAPVLRALAGGGVPVLAALAAGSVLAETDAAMPTAALVLTGLGIVALGAALPGGALRLPIEAGAGLVLLATALMLPAATGIRPLLLILFAVAALLPAVRRDGVVGAAGLRKHWSWAALALGVLALLDALQRSRIDLLEAHTLPPAGVLLLLAAWIGLHERMRQRSPSAAGPAALLAGLLLALAPSAVPADSLPRSLLVLSLGGATLIAGAFGSTGPARRWFDALVVAGAAAVLLGTPLRLAQSDGSLAGTEPWAAVAAALLVLAAVGLAGRWRDRRSLTALPPALIVAASAAVALAGAIAADAEHGALRGAIAVAVLVVVHPLAALLQRAPWNAWAGWTALALAALLGLRLLLLGGIETEAVTAPLGGAMVLAGALGLIRRPELRSWSALGPGMAVLLLPSLIASSTDPAVWRIVTVGALAVAAIVVGATQRLQAPFLLGITVALVHAVVQLQPQLRAIAEATPVFVWPVLGGALVLALAIRFERRLQTLRRVVMRVAALR